ncbi:flagellar basal-body rod protein FlgF [Neobacillus sp. PS3-12]|jgi:flagellar hook protein FlgE|uniref:flagellar basal-body rod protein FlgF n=1 Tax=Neobacillus sp. PS3-12 TaxID=3070677 RepID=UPI0027DEDB1A|nr:flagellar basal-body rod protein FlgF [Neobacillus sp. PS3-12]WML52005.1 flagellar basal-body rod protein FlgF [Neobacillus sp. PS3-12]
MLRSMYSGISGMKNFQTKLDVIGNNIANVNTFGYKKGRVTFKDTMSQMIAGPSAAQNGRGGKNGLQVGLGSALSSIDTIDTQASLETTGRALDLAVSGDGYFIVKQGDQQYYTRAGNFYLDNNGTLVNSDGLKVQAYPIENGNISNSYRDININVNGVLPPVITGKIQFTGNLAADANDGTVYSQQIKTIDENGDPQNSTIYFKKLSSNNWGVFINNPPQTSKVVTTRDPSTNISDDVSVTNPNKYTGTSNQNWTIMYDGTQSSPNSQFKIDTTGSGVFQPIPNANIVDNKFTQDGLEIKLPDTSIFSTATASSPVGTWTINVTAPNAEDYDVNFDVNGKVLSAYANITSAGSTVPTALNGVIADQRVSIPSGKVNDTTTANLDESKLLANLDFSKLTQLSDPSTAQVIPDGFVEGNLESFSVGSNGEINGVYSNGLIKELGQLALAKFSNPSGLNRTGGNLFQETINSGTPDINVAGNGRGTIAAGSLEMSNVDLSEEFTDMITAQRGFQANTKIITTSDEILQELLNLKR